VCKNCFKDFSLSFAQTNNRYSVVWEWKEGDGQLSIFTKQITSATSEPLRNGACQTVRQIVFQIDMGVVTLTKFKFKMEKRTIYGMLVCRPPSQLQFNTEWKMMKIHTSSLSEPTISLSTFIFKKLLLLTVCYGSSSYLGYQNMPKKCNFDNFGSHFNYLRRREQEWYLHTINKSTVQIFM
jgi:hypothetical protein